MSIVIFQKLVGTAIKNDFYMDDYLGGENTNEMAVQLRNDLRTVLQSGGFNLRKTKKMMSQAAIYKCIKYPRAAICITKKLNI